MTEKGDIFVNCELKMLSLDNISLKLNEKIPLLKDNCSDCERDECKIGFEHASTDALYVISPSNSLELYFIEFKKKDIFDDSLLSRHTEENISILLDKFKNIDLNHLNSGIESTFGNSNEIEDHIKYLKKSITEIRSAHSHLIKLKSLESLFCILPWLYKLYCHRNKIDCDMDGFKTFLSSCKKEYIVVYEDTKKNISNNRHEMYKLNFDCKNENHNIQRMSPYPFDKIRLRNPDQFTSFVKAIQISE